LRLKFLVPWLCLGVASARLCLDYDNEIGAVCGHSPAYRGIPRRSLGTRTLATLVARYRPRPHV
ncbi:MAG: hypothetical protein WBG50_10490, partial [Desulfomonilaceae bacterium]